MIGQVKTINGVKTVVPLSNEVATDSIESGNMESVTSNAVANAGFVKTSDVVDSVSDNNMNPVTSNAVYDKITTPSYDKKGSWGILGGASGSDKTNFVDLIRSLTGQNYGGGICGGSINTTSTSCGIPAGWYNFLYIPHRTGIGSDNYNYGNLLVFPMTQTNTYFYKIQMSGATVLNAVRFSGTQL